MLEVDIMFTKDSVELKRMCGEMYERTKTECGDSYEIMTLMSHGYIGGKTADMLMRVKAALSGRKCSSDWYEMVLDGACSALFCAMDGNQERAEKTIQKLEKEQKKFEGPYLDGLGAGYQRGAAVLLASLYHACNAIKLFGTQESKEHMGHAMKLLDRIQAVELELCLMCVKRAIDVA